MSIPVLNKIKILSTVSPSLANPHPNSPPLSTRGAVVAIEGADLTSVWSMTNNLTSQLEKDGKFLVKVFVGPDPNEMFGGPTDPLTGKRKTMKGPLGTADVLRLVEEWHEVSNEMRRFITTRPGIAVEVTESPAEKILNDLEMSEDSAGGPLGTQINVGSLTGRKPSDVAMSDESALKATKTPERVTFDLPLKTDSSKQNEDDKDKATSPKSGVSPKTLSKTSDLSIHTPPVTRSLSRSEASPLSASMPPPSTLATKLDTLPPPSPSKPSTPSSSTAPTSAPAAQPTTPSASTPTLPLPAPRPSLASAGPIPIALIPQYQLTTTNYAAVNTQFSDSYNPGSHWQWVAALWRGAIGPDVTIAIRSVPVPGSAGGDDTASEPPLSDERHSGHTNAAPRERTGSLAMAAAQGRGSQTGLLGDPATLEGKPQVTAGPGVEVRLLDYRVVVVRTMGLKEKEEAARANHGPGYGGGRVQNEEDRKAEEFWEKAKRRVGFEVAEFLRR